MAGLFKIIGALLKLMDALLTLMDKLLKLIEELLSSEEMPSIASIVLHFIT
jgi:hypothetical protein